MEDDGDSRSTSLNLRIHTKLSRRCRAAIDTAATFPASFAHAGAFGLALCLGAYRLSAGRASEVIIETRHAAVLPLDAGGWLIVAALFALAALFSAAEVAFNSPRRLRLEQTEKGTGFLARTVSRLSAQQARLNIAILVGQITTVTVYAEFLRRNLLPVFVDAFVFFPMGAWIVTALLGLIPFLILSELLPRIIASRNRESTARAIALPLQILFWVLTPVAVSLIELCDALFKMARLGTLRATPFVTDEKLMSAVTAGEARGLLEEDEGQMIQGILEFGDAQLKEILLPRPDITALPAEATVRDALEKFREHEFSRMPVYEDDLDHIVGLLVAKDLLSSVVAGNWDVPIRDMARPPRFVPETMTIHGFVRDAQRVQMHLAIVVDEYGGTAGIVTLEDAMEEVVGDIRDPNDDEPEQIVDMGEGRFQVDGSLPLDDLSSILGIEIDDTAHETVGGFLMSQTNKIPEKGDAVEHLGVRFTVEAVDGKRVTRLHVDLSEKTPREQTG